MALYGVYFCSLSRVPVCVYASLALPQGPKEMVIAHAPELCSGIRKLLTTAAHKLGADAEVVMEFLRTVRKLALAGSPAFTPVFASKKHMKSLSDFAAALPFVDRECGEQGIATCADVVRALLLFVVAVAVVVAVVVVIIQGVVVYLVPVPECLRVCSLQSVHFHLLLIVFRCWSRWWTHLNRVCVPCRLPACCRRRRRHQGQRSV